MYTNLGSNQGYFKSKFKYVWYINCISNDSEWYNWIGIWITNNNYILWHSILCSKVLEVISTGMTKMLVLLLNFGRVHNIFPSFNISTYINSITPRPLLKIFPLYKSPKHQIMFISFQKVVLPLGSQFKLKCFPYWNSGTKKYRRTSVLKLTDFYFSRVLFQNLHFTPSITVHKLCPAVNSFIGVMSLFAEVKLQVFKCFI